MRTLFTGNTAIAKMFRTGACRVALIGDSITGALPRAFYQTCGHDKITGIMGTAGDGWPNSGITGYGYTGFTYVDASYGDSTPAGTMNFSPMPVSTITFNGSPVTNVGDDLTTNKALMTVCAADFYPDFNSYGDEQRAYVYKGVGDFATTQQATLKCSFVFYQFANGTNNGYLASYNQGDPTVYSRYPATSGTIDFSGSGTWASYDLPISTSVSRSRLQAQFHLPGGDTPANGKGVICAGTRWSYADDGFEILRISQGGYLASNWLDSGKGTDAQFSQYLDAFGINVVVLALGHNDRSTDVAVVKANMKALVNRVRATTASATRPVVIITPYQTGDHDMAPFADAFMQIGSEMSNVLVLNLFGCFSDFNMTYGYGYSAFWVSGKAYQSGDIAKSPNDNKYYYCKNYGGQTSTTDPSSDSTNWVQCSGVVNIQPQDRFSVIQRNMLHGDADHPHMHGAYLFAQAFWGLMDSAYTHTNSKSVQTSRGVFRPR